MIRENWLSCFRIMKITKDSTLAEILELKGAEKILAKYNLPCLTCPFAKMEMESLKIGQICKLYGISLEKLLKELNKKNT
jgi:hypothetical protein